jgi:hypothetical protein
MNLIKFAHRSDYGHDWYVQVLSTKKWSLLQASFSLCEYPSWPYIQIKSGTGGLFSVLFQVYTIGFDIELVSRTWNWNFDQYVAK